MWIIWQELKAIIADSWGGIVSAARKAATEARKLRAFVAANYPLLIVYGFSIAGFILGVVGVFGVAAGLLESLLDALPPGFANPDRQPWGIGIVESLAMATVGIVVCALMLELGDRVEKRMAGKPKTDDASDGSGSES